MESSKITMIKFLELTLTITIFILHCNRYYSGGDTIGVMITTGTYFGYVIILASVYIGLCTGVPISAQLALNLIICILHYKTEEITSKIFTGFIHFTTGTFVGYWIILAGVFVGIFIGTPISAKMDLFYTLVGAVLFIIAGSKTFDYFSDYTFRLEPGINIGLIKAYWSIANGFVFIVDALYIYRRL